VIVCKRGAEVSADELTRFCKDRLSSYKVPKSINFVESLPHTEVGKVNKVKVRDTFVQAGVVGISQKQQG
jgi:acyl-CoA synthetase (AMP-forming)/AMP-acid ligase II